MDWFDIILKVRPHAKEVSLLLPFITTILALRILWSTRTNKILNKRLSTLAALGVLASGFMFFRADWGIMPALVLVGFLMLAVASASKGAVKNITTSISTVIISIPIMAIFLGYSTMLSLGPSMWPTAPKGFSIALMDFNAYGPNRPKLGDDINFSAPLKASESWLGGSYRKRVWGLPGDNIVIENDKIRVNGSLVADCSDRTRRIAPNAWLCSISIKTIGQRDIVWGQDNSLWYGRLDVKVPPGHIFVMGDNTIESSDSRERGVIPVTWITGKYIDGPKQEEKWKPWI